MRLVIHASAFLAIVCINTTSCIQKNDPEGEAKNQPSLCRKFIDEIKSKPFPLAEGRTINDFIAEAAGVEGSVDWNCFEPNKQEYKRSLVVQADILRASGDKIRIQYLLNKETNLSKAAYYEINGESKDEIDFYLELASMALGNQ